MKGISTKIVAFVLTMLFMGTSAVYAQTLVDDWGAIGNRLEATTWTLDNDASTPAGDAYLSGDVMSDNWTAIRGGFGGTQTATMDEALIVRGEFEIVGGPVDEWSPFRFGLFQHPDIDELRDQNTPMALWGTDDGGTFVSNEGNAFGYLITNQTGSAAVVDGNFGSGSLWAVNGGSWISTRSAGTSPLGSPFDHAPRRAVMPEGVYEFEMSVQPQADGMTEVRWYILHEDEESYWHAGVHTDSTAEKTEFNGFAFSFRPQVEGITGINLYAVEIDRGAPIEIPDAPFSSFFVDQWGFLGNNFGAAPGDSSWALTPGALVGDVTISGDAATGWATVAGSFGLSVTPTDEALIISGEITLEGGGFEDDNSFRFGLFNQNLGSQDSTETVGFVWGGDETASGYLFIPGNGTAAEPAWTSGDAGTIGAIDGGTWFDPLGAGATGLGTTATATTGTPTAGTYEFEMSVQPTEFGNEIRVILSKEDGSYHYEASKFDASETTTSYNSIVFATNNSTTTELTIEALEVEMGDPIPISTGVDDGSELPAAFTLRQNYPNPFNPTTTIQFDLPQTTDVQLDVFNLLGQKVMTLVSGKLSAGVYQVNFNAQNLASGLYIYRIEAADFVSAKRMMLIK